MIEANSARNFSFAGIELAREHQRAVDLRAEDAVERFGRLVAEELVLDDARAVDDAGDAAAAFNSSISAPKAAASRTSTRGTRPCRRRRGWRRGSSRISRSLRSRL